MLIIGVTLIKHILHMFLRKIFAIKSDYQTQNIFLPIPPSVVLLDVCQTGDQEVAGLTPAGWATFVHGDLLIMNFIYGHSLPSTDSRRALVSFWHKNMHNTG